MTFLETREDLDWLTEVHGVDTSNCVVAMLHGNEDAPDRVETFVRNHFACKPTVWTVDDGGDLRRTEDGDKR